MHKAFIVCILVYTFVKFYSGRKDANTKDLLQKPRNLKFEWEIIIMNTWFFLSNIISSSGLGAMTSDPVIVSPLVTRLCLSVLFLIKRDQCSMQIRLIADGARKCTS